MNSKGFLKEMLSERGYNGTSYISSKRVVGFALMLVCMGCMVYLVVKEGGTVIVENLLQTAMVMSASLLGISSITSIWKNGSIGVGEQSQEQKITQTTIKQPKITCPYHNTEEGS